MRGYDKRGKTGERDSRFGYLVLFFFISGGIALIYETVWQRQFALVFGSSAPSTAAVLAAYFTGLGAGGLVVGYWSRRFTRPLRIYALLEIAAGTGALFVSPLVEIVESAHPWLFETLADHPGAFTVAKTLLVFAALLIPTFCLGGTLPVLGRLVDHGRRRLGVSVGRLYVANTAGAALGTLSVPFFLLPKLGFSGTVMLCVSANIALGAAAFWLDRSNRPLSQNPATAVPVQTSRRQSRMLQQRELVLVPAVISGFATFALQVLWNRAFAQVHENSMYSFAIIVAVIICALSVGAQLARIGLTRGVDSGRLVGGGWILGGLMVMVGPALFLFLTDGLAYLPTTASGWLGNAAFLSGMAVAVLFVPMTLLGIAMPAIMESAGLKTSDTGRALGQLLALNIAGAVAGSLLGGFFMPQTFGLWTAIMGIGALLTAAGIWLWKTRSNTATVPSKRKVIYVAASLAILLPVAGVSLPRVHIADDGNERLLSVAEGTHGITAVVERPGSRQIKLNNHYALGGTAATGDERMQSHLPLLIHPAPRRIAFLGLGTGITAGAALIHPVDEVTVVELVPEVVTAARMFFHEENLQILDDPRTRVWVDDARHHLRASGEKFDVIIGDLVVPWRAGEGALFTFEQFVAARESLEPGGIFCQWLPLFQLSETEVNILARTFLSVFPRALVCRGDFSPNEPAIALIGTTNGLQPDAETIRRRLVEMQYDPQNPHLGSVNGFWMHVIGIVEDSDLPENETRINSEDHPWVELLGALAHSGMGDDRFTGKALASWVEMINRRSHDRMKMIGEQEFTAMTAGGLLAEMLLCIAEGDRDGAAATQEKLGRLIPESELIRMFP